AGSTVRRLYDSGRLCTLSSRSRVIGLSSFLWPGTARHSDVVAKPVGGHLREAPWERAWRRRPRGDRSLLPTLWQVVVGRTLGRNLRLLHATLSVRYLRTKMARSQRSR